MMYSTVLLDNKAKPAVTIAYSIVLHSGPCLGENASTGRYCIHSSRILVLFKHNTGFILAQYWTCSGPILVHIRIPQLALCRLIKV